jgi:hypothetical protein
MGFRGSGPLSAILTSMSIQAQSIEAQSIQAHATPNPNAMKFTLGARCFATPRSYASPQAAAEDPLAAALFALGGVYNVFMVQDFVTVNKVPERSWETLVEPIQGCLARYLATTR